MTRILLIAFVWIAASLGVGRAADRFTAQVVPTTLRGRTDGPRPVNVELNWTGPRLLEGRLELVLGSPYERARVFSGDLALANGRQMFRFVLPSASSGEGQIEVRSRFHEGSRVLDGGSTILSVPASNKRSFVACIGCLEGQSTPRTAGLWQSIRLEEFDPDAATQLRNVGDLSPAFVAADDLPASPLGYCTFDVVYLDAPSFAALTEKQLDALTRWVEGGGSAWVTKGASLPPRAMTFLQRFTPSGQSAAGASDSKPKSFQRFRPGLGRLIVAPEDADRDTPGWRDAIGFLWKLRANILERKEPVPSPQPEKTYAQQYAARTASRKYPNGYWMENSQWRLPYLSSVLLPSNIHLVPAGIIILIAVLFIAAIGPFDYYFLGLLKQRKFTWLLFPCLSVAFTIATIRISRHYLGTTDLHSTLIVSDEDAHGRIVRTNRIALTYTAQDRDFSIDVRNAVAYAFFAPAAYQGSIPSQFTVSGSARQWQPRYTRLLSFDDAEPPDPDLDWADFEAKALPEDAAAADLAARRLADPARVDVYILHGSEAWAAVHPPGNRMPGPFVEELCLRSIKPPFDLLSQISPSGGELSDDMPLLDLTNPNEWLVVAIHMQNQRIHITRRFYHGD